MHSEKNCEIKGIKQNSLSMHGQNTLLNGFAKFWSEFLCEIQKSDEDCKLYWTTSTLSAKAGFLDGRVNQQIISSLKRVYKEWAWKYKILYRYIIYRNYVFQKQWEAILLSKLDSILFSLMSSGKEFHMETP